MLKKIKLLGFKVSILILLVFIYSCRDNDEKDKISNISATKSDTIILKFIDYTGEDMERGFVGIHFKDVEELSSTIEENPKRMLSVDSSGILKLHKLTIANYYGVKVSDRLTAFYTLPPKTHQWFVLDLNKDSIVVKVVYL